MASAADGQPVGRASMGKALELAFGTMWHNPLTTFGTALLLGAIPGQLFQYFIVGAAPVVNFADAASLTGYVVSAIGGFGLALILSALVQAVIMRATIAHAQGERAGMAESLTDGLAVVFPLLGLSILMGLGLMIGFILLIIPGIILYIMWFVAVPVLVVERSGIFAAFSRSRYLTRGIRWRIFGLVVLLLVIASVLSGAVGVALVAGGEQTIATRQSTAFMIVTTLTSMVTTTFMATVIAAVYVQLRNWKDGPDSTRLEDIFA